MSSIWVAAVATPNRKLPRPESPESGPNRPNQIGAMASLLQLIRGKDTCNPTAAIAAGFTPCIVPEIPYTAQLRNGQGRPISGARTRPADPPDRRGAAGAGRRVAQGPAGGRWA